MPDKVKLIIVHKGSAAMDDPDIAACPKCADVACLPGYDELSNGRIVGDGSWHCTNCKEVYSEGEYEVIDA